MKRNVLILLIITLTMLTACQTEPGTNETPSGSPTNTPALTEGLTATDTPAPTPSTVPQETLPPTPTFTPTPTPRFTFTEMEKEMYTTADLNVRNLPSTEGEKFDVLKAWTKVTVLGQCNETQWYRILLENGKKGYVSGKYLADSKPTPTPTVTPVPTVTVQETVTPVPTMAPQETPVPTEIPIEMVAMPRLYGYTREDAETLLMQISGQFTVTVVAEEYSAKPAGTVIGQYPRANTDVLADETIRLTLSLGPEATPIPTEAQPPASRSYFDIFLKTAGKTNPIPAGASLEYFIEILQDDAWYELTEEGERLTNDRYPNYGFTFQLDTAEYPELKDGTAYVYMYLWNERNEQLSLYDEWVIELKEETE